MFYQSPEFVGRIRNLRFVDNKYYYEIFINDKLVKKGYVDHILDKDQVIKYLVMIGNQHRQAMMLKHELEYCQDELYVKWSTDVTRYGRSLGLTGYYGIFHKDRGVYMTSCYDNQNLHSALEFLKKKKIENQQVVDIYLSSN